MYVGVTLTNENNLITSLSSSKTLNNISVSARYNSESFEVSGLPTGCSIVLTGEAANVNSAATKSGYCLLNLEGLTEGTHTVKTTFDNGKIRHYIDDVKIVEYLSDKENSKATATPKRPIPFSLMN